MRSRRKSKRPVVRVRPGRSEYLFFPTLEGPYANQSLSELQQSGWVIKSSSIREQGGQMLLLSRPKVWQDKVAIQE